VVFAGKVARGYDGEFVEWRRREKKEGFLASLGMTIQIKC
jgi:hypothetical protein